jgi:hypothetical protein
MSLPGSSLDRKRISRSTCFLFPSTEIEGMHSQPWADSSGAVTGSPTPDTLSHNQKLNGIVKWIQVFAYP